ncbi:unnamed protein product [Sphenostylis stenocarpa]|uniref:Uncharacterized protein n=1 Tax=Sphenostylis stenocarpa TaxID=92480 RepID=A0AA86SWA0_9FABA|nr:unnamed protein product [Sphenostylis stenocarpa]
MDTEGSSAFIEAESLDESAFVVAAREHGGSVLSTSHAQVNEISISCEKTLNIMKFYLTGKDCEYG